MNKENGCKADYKYADQVGVFGMMWNKLKTIRTYKSIKHFKRLCFPGDYLEAVRVLERESKNWTNAIDRAAGLWYLERLIRESRVFENGSFLLKEPAIERFKPILHVGWGMDVLSETGFDFQRFSKVIRDSADSRYRLLALEPIGVVYLAGQQPLKSRFIGINVPAVPGPGSLRDFFDHFDDAETQMISHGYGRGMYFKVYSLYSALRKARECPVFFESLYVIQGIAFAYTMVNIAHIDKIFLTADKLSAGNFGPEETMHFHEGITVALSFLEWNFPGFLNTIEESKYTRLATGKVKFYHTGGGVFHL